VPAYRRERGTVRGVAVGFWGKCCLGGHAGADAPPFLLRMATDIAPASVASGRAVPIGAAYRRGIHAMLLLVVRGSVSRGVCRDPHFRYKCASPRLRTELSLRGQTGKGQQERTYGDIAAEVQARRQRRPHPFPRRTGKNPSHERPQTEKPE